MKLQIDLIRTDGGTQMRAFTDDSVVEDYREAMEAGAKFPPVDVFHDGTDYWLTDGFHRLIAATELKRKAIEVTLHEGTLREAILHAVGANAHHGKRRSNADKRRCAERLLRDPEWANRTDKWIADACAVSWRLIADMRREMNLAKSHDRIARNGRKIRTEKISAASKNRAAENARKKAEARANDAPPPAHDEAPVVHSENPDAPHMTPRLRAAIAHVQELEERDLLELRHAIDQRVATLRGQHDAA